MNNCGCKRPAFGPEPHAPVPLHGGGFVPNAIEWLKKRIDKLFGTAVFTVNGHEPEGGNVDVIVPSKVSELENDAGYLTEHQDVSGIAATAEEALSVATDAAENSVRIINGKAPTNGNVKIVLDDLADKDGNIETTKNIMVSRDDGESHAAVALYSDLISEIDTHNNDGAAHPELMATVARVFATKTEVDAKADKSALQAEVDRAQAAETQLTTKTNELDTAKADKSALTAHVENTNNPHGVTAAQVGAVSISRSPDSDQTFDWSPPGVDGYIRLFGTYYKTGIGLGLWSGGGSLFNYHDDTSDIYQFPTGKSGTFALTSDIADAVKNKADKATTLAGYGITDAATKTDVEAKADKSALQAEVDRAQAAETQLTTKANELVTAKANRTELPYSLVVKEIKNGVVSLDDRADNYVDARALGSSDSLDIDFPVLVNGRSRDFVLAVECGANPPTISYAAFATIMAEDASTLAPEQGMNIYAFTEFKTNMFLVARKTVDTVVVNTPESSNQVLLAMQKRGIDTTNITDFGVVASTLGLGDDSTPQDAIDAVMN